MVAAQELTVRQAAALASRSEETIRRWIWSGRLHAVKRGSRYVIDARQLEEVIVELEAGSAHPERPALTMEEWLDEVAEWKAGLPVYPASGPTAADLVIEDRRARR
jgi:excisionase family DNA binding protein